MKPFISILVGNYCCKYVWPVPERHGICTRSVDMYLVFWGTGTKWLMWFPFSRPYRHFHNRVTALYAPKSYKQHGTYRPLINRYGSANCSIMYKIISQRNRRHNKNVFSYATCFGHIGTIIRQFNT
jgi:hypothetical protein